ncbi:zinc finger BED domain-containing protein 1-like [Mizuhopecten yessoensis]|uniref:zinc finger BED domain-containing protein 1-like n=1 Tax=Mizuhopecten yessoensis TaxID=6573 RepID=UPI000B4580AC|nr:zinc finger BED domain-containing protein 1-like [Mizuhopecten yessoensis]XP_021354288.1 zinc finger BED domain-containing protein 1-like [Mizuhopecten yessoensis]XP_021355338.1 zinc finger BED domain-containing protein 1-like [Mizuhopecten yessoensis]XP_021364991.1 zinc finger BED domain-containing protein 1-like [Mizuhopecten yessoensis]XP_021365151.1 zinc finger BED domain-containing protein 1-like [Mizuhopecten yessoensis]
MAEEKDESFSIIPNKKAKSDIWQHFGLKQYKEKTSVEPGVAVCKKCRTEVKYSGGTTNLGVHLDRHHKMTVIGKSAKKSFESSIGTACTSGGKQKTLFELSQSKYSRTSEKYKQITAAIGKFIVKDLRPFSIVSNEGFLELMKVLDPRYDVPSRIHFSTVIIPDFYEEVRSNVLKSMSKSETVALTTDGWTSRATESYVTVTSSFITKDWKLQNFVLQTRALPESHTGINIANVLTTAINEWNIPKKPYVPLVTDNAANMLVAAREADCKPHIGCYAHTLNLAAQKALKINSVSRILGRVRRVVSFFHRSTTAAAVLKSKTKLLCLKEMKLVQDVSTRWNSAVDMLERYLLLQPAIFAALMCKDIKRNQHEVSTLSCDDLRLAEEIMECLRPLREITQVLCSEKLPTVSIILPLQKKLLTQVLVERESDSNIIKQMKNAMSSDLSERYTPITDFLEECSAVDPRIKVSFRPADEQFMVYNRLSLIAGSATPIKVKTEPGLEQVGSVQPGPVLPNLPQLQEDTQSQDESTAAAEMDTSGPPGLSSILSDVIFVKHEEGVFKSQLEKASDEVACYKEMELLPMDQDPLNWWKMHELQFPLLSLIAKCRLCIPATSVPSERIFSTAGDIVTAQRSQLSPDVVDKLIFLKKNM